MQVMDDEAIRVPVCDEEDECATQVWRGPPRADGGAGAVLLRASTPPDAAVQARPASCEPPIRDRFVHPPASRWTRLKAAAGRFADAVLYAFFGAAPLSARLPPLPAVRSGNSTRVSAGAVPDQEQGEFALLWLLRAPPSYQRAAVDLAYRALAERRGGDECYAELVVHFMVSRMRPDDQGRVSTVRIRDMLCHMSFAKEIAPALRRLSDRGTVVLVLKNSTDPMAELLQENITHVELRVPV